VFKGSFRFYNLLVRELVVLKEDFTITTYKKGLNPAREYINIMGLVGYIGKYRGN
jgi:hypothetical protein